MLNHSLFTLEFPQTLTETKIPLLFKKGGTKNRHVAKLIKQNQIGFIKGWNSTSDIRRLLNVIQAFEQISIDSLELSVDAEKVFN